MYTKMDWDDLRVLLLSMIFQVNEDIPYDDGSHKPIDLHLLQGAFYILLIGIILSSVAFLIEVVYKTLFYNTK